MWDIFENKAKRLTFYKLFALGGSLFIAIALFSTRVKAKLMNAEQGDAYSFTLDSSSFSASNLPSEFNTSDPKKFSDSDYVEQTFSGPDAPVINYFLAKKNSNNKLVLAPGGQVFNYSSSETYNGRITGISSIVVNYSGGTLYAQEGDAGSYSIYGQKVAITSGAQLSFASLPNFLMISNSRANTTINSIKYNYSCSEAGFIVERLGSTYNCGASNGNSYTLTRSGNSVTFNNQSGTISVTSSGNFTISLASGSVTYSGTISSDYKTLNVTSTTGSSLNIVSLNRVYIMDDFEGYSQTGTGLKSGKTVASDLRFAYYGDYAGGGYSTWIGSSSFDVAQSSDYVNLTTAVKHGGSKAATFKGWTGGWTRAWSRETFDLKHHYNFGSGDKVSFWARGAYTNTGCTTASTKDAKIRVQVYYDKFSITDSNRNSTTYGSGTKDFTIPASSAWTEYSFSIDPTKKVYAINIMVDNSTISSYKNIFIPIDDITIYTTPIYELPKTYTESATQFTKTYHGSVKVNSTTFTIKLALGANGYIYAYAGADMEPTSYAISGSQIVIETQGSYMGQTFGTWTGTLSNSNNRISIPKNNITGSIKSYISTTTIVLNADTKLVDGSEGNLSTIETKINRQYHNGSSWTTDTGNSDRLSVNSEYYIQGNNSIRVRPYGSGNMRVIMNPTLAASIGTMDSVAFWFYVPAGVSYTINIFSYKDSTPSSTSGRYAQMIAKTYDGNNVFEAGWQYLNMGLNSAGGFGKNFAIFVGTNSAQTILDYITYF